MVEEAWTGGLGSTETEHIYIYIYMYIDICIYIYIYTYNMYVFLYAYGMYSSVYTSFNVYLRVYQFCYIGLDSDRSCVPDRIT